MYTKKFFMAAFIFLFIIVSLVALSDDNINTLAGRVVEEPFATCVIKLVHEIITGKLVVSEDGKYLHYSEES